VLAKLSLENLEGAQSFKKPTCTEHNNIKIALNPMIGEEADWIHLAVEEAHWQALP
jgi:hypothetical protein